MACKAWSFMAKHRAQVEARQAEAASGDKFWTELMAG